MFQSVKINKGSFCLLVYSGFTNDKVKLKREYKSVEDLIKDYNEFYNLKDPEKLYEFTDKNGYLIIQSTNKYLIPIILKSISKYLKEFEK